MVEKVFISPNRVRAYGNIINMKTGDDFTLVNSELTVTTDMVDGAEMTVFQFEVEGGISIALTSSSSTCNVGDNVLLTATVRDRSTPVEAAEVTFKVGETVLGTDETDANGVATYTYAASTAGSFSFTASYQDSTSSVVSVSVNHSYSLAFSQATYTASGGSATLECTLLEDNVAKSGASVTVTGSDGSVYNGITNSQGIASVTVSNISTTITFTASYSNVSDTCTVTVVNYLFYDKCNRADGLSNYGTSVLVRGSNAVATLEYDSTENCYALYGQGNYHAMVPIPALNDEDQYSIEMEIKMASSQFRIAGFYLDNRNDTTSYGMDMSLSVYDRRIHSRQYKVSSDGSEQNSPTSNQITANTWYRLRMTVNGSSLTGTLYNLEGTQIVTITKSLSVSNKQMGLFVFCEKGTSGSRVYIRNIKAEAL